MVEAGAGAVASGVLSVQAHRRRRLPPRRWQPTAISQLSRGDCETEASFLLKYAPGSEGCHTAPVDFSLSEQEQAVADLSRQNLGDLSTPERHKHLEGRRHNPR